MNRRLAMLLLPLALLVPLLVSPPAHAGSSTSSSDGFEIIGSNRDWVSAGAVGEWRGTAGEAHQVFMQKLNLCDNQTNEYIAQTQQVLQLRHLQTRTIQYVIAGNRTFAVGPSKTCRTVMDEWDIRSNDEWEIRATYMIYRKLGINPVTGKVSAAGPWWKTTASFNPYRTCDTCR